MRKSSSHHQETRSVPQAAGSGTLCARDDKQRWKHKSNADICKKAVDTEYIQTSGNSEEFCGWTAKRAIFGAAIVHNFWVWKIRFQNQETICSDFPLEAMLWITEVEMVDSLDELNTSRSASGKNLENFEMLDATIASALNKIIQIQENGQSRAQKALKEDWFSTRMTD